MADDSASQADIIARAERFGVNIYSPLPVVLDRGEGCFVWDVGGRRYFDFLSAYSALNQGHRHPKIVAALCEQACRLTLTSRAFHNALMGPMLERVARLTGFEKILPMNTGAEAVETAIKAMRRWGYGIKNIPPARAEIIVMEGNFHGRTTTVISFSSDKETKGDFGPFTPGFISVPFGDRRALEAAITDNTAGVLLEPIQGEAGVIIPPDDFLPQVKKICDRENILFCLDEIQTGLGRTGKMFAWEHSGSKPDIIILGKALSGGVYPVSCICADSEVMDVFTLGSHGSTYGANPLAAAVALAAIDVIEEEDLCTNAARLGEITLSRLKKEVSSTNIREIRGRGLMVAVEYSGEVAYEIVRALQEAGILAKDTHGTIIRLMPPLVITEEQLNEALELVIPVLNRF